MSDDEMERVKDRWAIEDRIALRRAVIQEEELDAIEAWRAGHGGYASEIARAYEDNKLAAAERRDAMEFRAWLRQRDDELFRMILHQNEILERIANALSGGR